MIVWNFEGDPLNDGAAFEATNPTHFENSQFYSVGDYLVALEYNQFTGAWSFVGDPTVRRDFDLNAQGAAGPTRYTF